MSVKFITGASGHGKTYELYSLMTSEAIANPKRRYVLVVPEQSSLQAQKDLVMMNPNKGIFNIDVLTFGRMTYAIFDEMNFELPKNIDDTGKNLIVRRILNDVADKLLVIKASNKPGFINDLKSIISELKQYGIKPKELDSIAERMSGRLAAKMLDIKVIYEAFENYIEGRYSTAEDRPEAMLTLLDNSHYFEDAVVAFDDFTGFTPVQYNIIEKISHVAKDMFFTATLPHDEQYNVIHGEEDLFLMSKDMMIKVARLCEKNGLDFSVEKVCTDESKYRFMESPALAFMHNNLFKYNKNTYAESTEDINFACMDNVTSELRYVAAEIIRLTAEKGLRYREMAVVTGDMDMYSDEAARVFKESGIPVFIDAKRSILFNPLVEYLRSAADIICDDYTYDGVMSLLKNGLCPIERDDVDILDNYIIAYGIRGHKRYNDIFTKEYPGKADFKAKVNEIRLQFNHIMEPFSEVMSRKNNTVHQYVMAVYNFLEAENAYEKMLALSEEYAFTDREIEFRNSYSTVVKLLEQIEALLGDEEMRAEEFFDILMAGFSEIKLGTLPPVADCVMVGDIQRTRLEHIKVLFIVGVNEGIIPKLASTKGILSDADRKLLAEGKVELAPTPREKVFIQNFYLYLNMTEPSKALYLTYHKFDPDGKESKESRIFAMLKKQFPEVKIRQEGELGTLERITNAQGSRNLMAEQNVSPELIMYYTNSETYRLWLDKVLDAIEELYSKDKLSEIAAEELYAQINTTSVSRAEEFAGCEFAYFAKYGLELSERKVYELGAIDMGIIFHGALEMFFLELKATKRKLVDLSEEERNVLVAACVDKAIAEHSSSFFLESETNAYMKQRLINIVDRTIWALNLQLSKGQFEPSDFEKSFEREVDGVKITGKIDRIDVAEDEEAVHLKVIDYKSGKKEISQDDVYAGTKLQLMVYLDTILNEKETESPVKKVYAAGALYNSLENPIVSENKDNEKYDDIGKLLLEMKPVGFVGYESVPEYDDWEKGASLVVPVTKDNSGAVKLSNTVCTDAQLRIMAKYATKKVVELFDRIKKGDIATNPIKDKCDYCPYSGVCRIHKNSEVRYRKLEKISKADNKWLKFQHKEEE